MHECLLEDIQEIRKQGLYRENPTYMPVSATHVIVDGKKNLMLASNNYLGLTHHPMVKNAALEAICAYGTGSGGARLTTGSHPCFAELEQRIAEFKETEAAVVFNTGYMANLGAISALMGKGDIIFSDALNHASIIDGCKLSGVKIIVFPHNDTETLRQMIKENSGNGKKMIVVDGVFSMDGDIAPLPALVSIAQEFQTLLMVDDAHSTGVLGGGKGTAAHFGLKGKIDVQMGTLSKALGAEGAYVAGSKTMIEWMINRARSYIFSTALSPASVASANAALRVLMEDSSYTNRLLDNASYMRLQLENLGVKLIGGSTPILPIMIGDPTQAVLIAERLKEEGIILSAIRPPTVPMGESRLRLTVSAAHSKKDLAEAAEKIARVVREIRDDKK